MLEILKQIISNGVLNLLISKYEGLQGTASYFILISAMLLCVIISYILGSINFALILSKKMYNDDIRLHGSGNAGMTNMLRTYGKNAAAKTFLGDGLKAFLSCTVGYILLGYLGCFLAGLFCVIGHAFPIFYKFKGGKGIVVAAISILMGDPLVFIILLFIFAIIVLSTKFVSLASMMCMLIYPLVLNGVRTVLLGGAYLEVPIAFCMSILIIFLHRSNIKRLYTGTESKTYLFKKHEETIETAVSTDEQLKTEDKKPMGKINPNTSKKKIKKKNNKK